MAPILVALHGEKAVTLIPSGYLSLLPLHAAWREDEQGQMQRRYVLDDLCVTYAPSAQALYYAHLAENRPAETVLAVDNPDGSLTFTEAEIQEVLAHFPQAVHLQRTEATKGAVCRAIPRVNILHFSTHGMAGWGSADQSRLKLADDNLTLPEIFDLHLENARLAILSACETGVAGTNLLDEVVSLPSGWMQAGVPGVIGSLWSVNDISTAMLMAHFYDLWRDGGLAPPEALRRAQLWLRDLARDETNLSELEAQLPEAQGEQLATKQADIFYKAALLRDFSHPFYWAAFTYTGL
jgi:CHAT domain-containing protein